MNYSRFDQANVAFILQRYPYEMKAIYRTGSTVTRPAEAYDVDYFAIADTQTHAPYHYITQRQHLQTRKWIDIITLTTADLAHPRDMQHSRRNKAAWLAREVRRPRILLYGSDCFLSLLNAGELEAVCAEHSVTADTLESVKQQNTRAQRCIAWG